MSGSILVNLETNDHSWLTEIKKGHHGFLQRHTFRRNYLRSITKCTGGTDLKRLLMMLELVAGLKSHPCSPNEAHVCLAAFVIFGFTWKTNQTVTVCVCVRGHEGRSVNSVCRDDFHFARCIFVCVPRGAAWLSSVRIQIRQGQLEPSPWRQGYTGGWFGIALYLRSACEAK